MVPDLNRINSKFRGKLNLINKLRLMWDLKVAPPQRPHLRYISFRRHARMFRQGRRVGA